MKYDDSVCQSNGEIGMTENVGLLEGYILISHFNIEVNNVLVTIQLA